LVAAEKISQLLSVIVANSSHVQGWIDLLLFPSRCLHIPGGRTGQQHQKSLVGKLNEIIRLYQMGQQA